MLSKKSKTKLLKVNLSQEKPKITSSFSYSLQDLSENPEVLVFTISLIVSIILVIADIGIFLINQKLKYDYISKQSKIKTYQIKLNSINNKMNGIKSQYIKLKEMVDSFKYENNIFKIYSDYYDSMSSLINNMLSSFEQNNIYNKSFAIKLNPDNISPSSIQISINVDSPKNASDLLSKFNYKNGCYDFDVKNICINSITQNSKSASNSVGFIYFNNSFQLQGSIIREVNHHEK